VSIVSYVRLLVRAFTVYVRPIVEYNRIIWLPHLINEIDHVQRRFTKRLRGLRNRLISYQNRLAKRGLCTLELRRLHFDLMYCYKIVFGLVRVNTDDFFTFSTATNTRGHRYKLYKNYCSNTVRKSCFSELVINIWNSLPPTVNFISLSAFKRSLKKSISVVTCMLSFSRTISFSRFCIDFVHELCFIVSF